MSDKIVLIDGHSILNRAFYGVPLLSNAKGLHTNAVYGFLNILLKLEDDVSPDGVAVTFDLKEPTFRQKPSDMKCTSSIREQESRCHRSFMSRYRY